MRSESCGNELLAAGRVTTDAAFGLSCSGGGGSGNGSGEEGAKAGRAEAVEAAPRGETPPGRSHVSRSQSLDLGTAAADGAGERRDLSLGREEDFSRRKVRINWVVVPVLPARGTARGEVVS